MTQESLRQNVGVVQQDVFLFAASILENIRHGKPGASEEEVARAAKLAEIYDDIVALPEGFNTYVGEQGTPALRRTEAAHLHRPDLPEGPAGADSGQATSALDSVTEAKLQETFESWPTAAPPSSLPTGFPPSAMRTGSPNREDGRITEAGRPRPADGEKWRLCGAGADAGADRPWKE